MVQGTVPAQEAALNRTEITVFFHGFSAGCTIVKNRIEAAKGQKFKEGAVRQSRYMVWKEGKSLTNKEKGSSSGSSSSNSCITASAMMGTVSHAFNIHDMGQVHKLTPTQGCHLTARHEGHAQLGKRLDNPTARTLGIGCPVAMKGTFPW